MIYIYRDPTAVLRDTSEIGRRSYRVFLLFLGTEYDEQFLREVEALSADIHNLTGPHAAAFLCTPPPPNPPAERGSFGGFQALGRPSSWADWPEFVAAMTKGSYELAQALEIPFDRLPVVVFLLPGRDEPEYSVLSLRGTSFREVYRDIRSILSRWYQSNADLVKEIAGLQILAKKPWGKVPNSDPDLPSFERFAREEVIPIIAGAVKSAKSSEGLKKELDRRIEHLSTQPRDTASVSNVLPRADVRLQIDGSEIGADDFKDSYYGLVQKVARARYDQALSSLSFPLDLVSAPQRKLAIKRLFDRVDLGSIEAEAGGVKFKYNPLAFLRALLGIQNAQSS